MPGGGREFEYRVPEGWSGKAVLKTDDGQVGHVELIQRHHRLAACGQEITLSGQIQECFERKGRKFAVAGIQMSESDGPCSHPIATVRHTFIYEL